MTADVALRSLALARENALLGGYQSALDLYAAVADALSSLGPPWAAVAEDAASEARVVQQLQSELECFASAPPLLAPAALAAAVSSPVAPVAPVATPTPSVASAAPVVSVAPV